MTTPTPTPPRFRPTPTVTRAAPRSSTTVHAPGGEYRAYPEVAGVVRFWNSWDGPRTPLVEAWIDAMTARYPSVEVESDVEDGASTRERLVTALASGSPPNVMMLRSDSVAFFAEQGALLPLDDLLARDGITRDWFKPPELVSRTWADRIYGLPHATAGAQHLLFVNVGLLEKIGVDPARPIDTWQDLEALVEPAQHAGLLVMDPTRIPAGMTAHQVWTYANGGRYWDDDLQTITWTEEASVHAAEWLLRFVKAQAGGRTPGAIPGDPTTALTAEAWAAERHLCCVNGAGWFFQLQQQAQRLRYVAYSFPRNAQHPASAGATPSTGGWMLAIPKAAPDHEAAWEWIKLTCVSESACAFHGRQGRPSPLVGCDERAGLASTHPFWPAVSSSLGASVRVPVSPVQPHLERVYRGMQDDVLQGRRAPRDALEAAAHEAQQILDHWHADQKRK